MGFDPFAIGPGVVFEVTVIVFDGDRCLERVGGGAFTGSAAARASSYLSICHESRWSTYSGRSPEISAARFSRSGMGATPTGHEVLAEVLDGRGGAPSPGGYLTPVAEGQDQGLTGSLATRLRTSDSTISNRRGARRA